MISINISKAQDIVHEARRAARAKEFASLDIKATIPSEAEAAEAARVEVRAKYTAMQAEINAATRVSTLKVIMGQLS